MGSVASTRRGHKRDDVIFLYTTEDTISEKSIPSSAPAQIYVNDDPEDVVFHPTVSSVSVHKTEEEMYQLSREFEGHKGRRMKRSVTTKSTATSGAESAYSEGENASSTRDNQADTSWWSYFLSKFNFFGAK